MEFIKGMDISMLPELEDAGVTYYDNGNPEELLSVLQKNGVNAIRLRIWNDPYDVNHCPYGGGTNDIQAVLNIAQRIRDKGMYFLLDFHYSDFWTDPKKQIKPKMWRDLSGEKLGSAIYQYTETVLRELKEKGLAPDMVQVGNEITNGFVWPEGQLDTYLYLEEKQPERKYEKMFSLLNKGIQAVRDVDSGMKIVLHLDVGGDNGLYREWFDAAELYNVDYDVIGLSYYPYWHASLEKLESNICDISQRYQKDILVVETAYGFTLEGEEDCSLVFTRECENQGGYPATPEGQAEFLKDLITCIRKVPENRGKGFFYWEPAWIPGNGTTWATLEGQEYTGDRAPVGNTWANQALFDYKGNVLPGLAMLKEI